MENRSGNGLTERTARIRIIGIDPGLRRTGWGVIDSDGARLVFVACGSVVSDNGESLGARLRQIFDGLQEVLARLSPEEAAIEQTFVNRDGAATARRGASPWSCRRYSGSRSPNTRRTR